MVTPSQPMEARGTAKVVATELIMVLCIAAVNAPVEPEKISDRRSTALPGDGVTSGVLEGVSDDVPVPLEVTDSDGVPEGLREAVGV